jgi:hypothetical protein
MSDNAETSDQRDRQSAWKTVLLSRPVHNEAAEVMRDDEQVHIRVRNEIPWYLQGPARLLFRIPERKTHALDPLGASIWRWCDGRQTVEEIVDLFARDHELTFHESRVLVSDYLRQLTRRGIIAVIVEPREQSADTTEH